MTSPHKPLRLWLIACALLSLLPSSRAEDNEDKLKAAFLFNFAKLVRWPGNSSRASEPLNICVLGDESFYREVSSSVGGKSIESRKISVTYLPEAGRLEGCDLLFISWKARSRWPRLRRLIENQAVLTVGESAGFAENGGVINLYKEGNHMRFEINQAAAEKAGLKINSRLLQLAKLVHSKRP